VVAANGRLTTDQADVMMVEGNGRWARTAYHGVKQAQALHIFYIGTHSKNPRVIKTPRYFINILI
jgi:hypothetical protein